MCFKIREEQSFDAPEFAPVSQCVFPVFKTRAGRGGVQIHLPPFPIHFNMGSHHVAQVGLEPELTT